MTKLPKGWELCRIGEVLEAIEMTGKNEVDRDVWYIDISSIDNKTNRIVNPKRVVFSKAPSRARQKVKAGDVLFSTVRPYLRKIAAVDVEYSGEIASTGFTVLRVTEGIVVPAYLFYKCISHDFVSALTDEQYGVSYPAIKDEQVKVQPLELAPLNEQRRIVVKIEMLFDEIDKGVESLRAAKTNLGLYRQSLLKVAFAGRLTADWCARNPNQLENPDVLLARIKQEREDRYKAAFDDWQKAVIDWREGGGKGKKPAKPKRLVDASAVIPISQKMNVPDNWAVAILKDLIPFDGIFTDGDWVESKDQDPDGEVRLIQLADIGDGYFVDKSLRFLTSAKAAELKCTFLKTGDLLVARMPDPLGRCCIFPHEGIDKFVTVVDVCVLRIGLSVVDTRYLMYAINAQIVRNQIKALQSGSTRQRISRKNLSTVLIPVPTLNEQSEITRILDAHLESSERLEAEIDTSLIRADMLRQSILKKAFSGALVPQDPNDEPASTLLDRIKAEKAVQRQESKQKRRGRTRATA